jgi:ribosomal protein S3AE
MAFYLKRMVRRGTNYVEDSFETECKDATVRLKPFLVTRRKVSRAVRKALRNKTKEELEKWAKESTSEKMFEEVLKNKVQRELSTTLKKIYPLSLCEIRVINVVEKETQ